MDPCASSHKGRYTGTGLLLSCIFQGMDRHFRPDMHFSVDGSVVKARCPLTAGLHALDASLRSVMFSVHCLSNPTLESFPPPETGLHLYLHAWPVHTCARSAPLGHVLVAVGIDAGWITRPVHIDPWCYGMPHSHGGCSLPLREAPPVSEGSQAPHQNSSDSMRGIEDIP